MISLLLMIGIQESARANAVIVVIKVAVVLVFIALGWASTSIPPTTPVHSAEPGRVRQIRMERHHGAARA